MGSGQESLDRRSGRNASFLENERERRWSAQQPGRVKLSSDLSIAGTVIDYRNWELGLGRRFRSLKLWFVLRSFGIEGFREYIRRVSFTNAPFPRPPYY